MSIFATNIENRLILMNKLSVPLSEKSLFLYFVNSILSEIFIFENIYLFFVLVGICNANSVIHIFLNRTMYFKVL